MILYQNQRRYLPSDEAIEYWNLGSADDTFLQVLVQFIIAHHVLQVSKVYLLHAELLLSAAVNENIVKVARCKISKRT